MITSICQEHPFGCGVACVAFIVGDSYKNALKLFGNSNNATVKGYYCKDLIFALAQSGFKYRYHKYKNNYLDLLFKNGTIVYTKKSSNYPAGHYLVKTVLGWMNPWSNFPNMPIQSKFQENLMDEVEYVIYKEDKC